MAEPFFGKTDTGKQRKNNEDTFLVQTVAGGSLIAGCVIDGVGGYEGGEVAANLAKKTITDFLKQLPGNEIEVMKQAFLSANVVILREKNASEKNAQMACVATMAIVDIPGNKFYYAHVGDTRLYLLRDDSLVKVTRDHSVVGFLEDSGRLTEEAAMQHPKRNEINKALGFEKETVEADDFIETGESPFLPGDIILICSDGLTDMIGNASITKILRFKAALKIKAKMLIDAANDAGGKDNITVVLIQNDKSRQAHEVTKPAVSTKIREETSAEHSEKHREEKTELPVLVKSKVKSKSNTGLIVFLTILCIALFIALLWVLLKDKAVIEKPVINEPTIDVRDMTPGERTFFNLFQDSAQHIIIVPFSKDTPAITLTRPLEIVRDSITIKGNGLVLTSDSSYHGPAISITSTSKRVILDSITIENFDVGILVKTPGIVLKNVTFHNCRVPLQYEFLFPGKQTVSGILKDSVFHYLDSIPNR